MKNNTPPYQLTPHFNIKEFACKDGTAVPTNLLHNARQLATNLEIIRSHLKEPIYINSGYRTVTYNKKIGGAVGSQHLLANAVDIRVKGASPFFVFGLIRGLMRDGLIECGAVILYKDFVHYDRRGTMIFLDKR